MKLLTNIKSILLNDWDPIGVKSNPNAQAEYDQYAIKIAGMLYNGTTQDKLIQYLNFIVSGEFGLVANNERSVEVSQKLIELKLEKV